MRKGRGPQTHPPDSKGEWGQGKTGYIANRLINGARPAPQLSCALRARNPHLSGSEAVDRASDQRPGQLRHQQPAVVFSP
jgi:hypothetical protein